MKEINIAATLVAKRRAKGITQDELAEYMGVSKASVSKWETGQSYPDITFLPQIAAYFNITIDELMGYTPQMTIEGIRNLYKKLSQQFANMPFEAVLTECRSVIKKYYACFPLLMQMSVLLINHHMLAGSIDDKETILREVIELCIRIKTESNDAQLSKEAISIQALCCLALNAPQSTLDLLGETIHPVMPEEALISKAYLLMGNTAKAKETLQISMYQYLLILFDATINYLHMCADDYVKAEEILRRILALADIYGIDRLNPNTAVLIYAAGARIYCMNGYSEKTIDMLNKVADICINHFFPYTLHGDSFFDSINGWLSDLDLGATPLRSEKVIKESLIQDIVLNPVFASLAEDPAYMRIVQRLKDFVGGN